VIEHHGKGDHGCHETHDAAIVEFHGDVHGETCGLKRNGNGVARRRAETKPARHCVSDAPSCHSGQCEATVMPFSL
jgi:hypothetical protein